MADEPDTVDDSGDDGATFSKADVSRIVSERLAKERAKLGDVAALKAKAAKLDEIEAANKSELDKATEARAAVERERDDARLELLRRDAADTAELPRSWASRLKGATKEELEADAKELAKELGPKSTTGTGGRPVADLRPAALPAGDQSSNAFDADAWIRRQAGVR